MTRTAHILRIDASMRRTGSKTRSVTDAVVERLSGPRGTVTVRDLADGSVGFVDDAWIDANFTDSAARTEAQASALARSDVLVAELQAADTIVIGVPVYNFGIPAALKAWVDMIARARVTFRYTEDGPIGLLDGKRAVLVFAAGGVPMGSAVDFASSYMRHVLGFVGITEVKIVDASRTEPGQIDLAALERLVA